MSEKKNADSKVHLLKKRDILKALNISRTTFERKLAEGSFPQPFVWVTSSPQGRRWSAEDVKRCFGVTVE